MLKGLLVLLLPAFLFSCAWKIPGMGPGSKSKSEIAITEPTNEEKAANIYAEAVKALDEGDAYYAGNKFKEVEKLVPRSKWAAKASIMESYAQYSRNSYSDAIFGLERHIKNYPGDKNIPYAHYLIAICYYEQILDCLGDLMLLGHGVFGRIKTSQGGHQLTNTLLREFCSNKSNWEFTNLEKKEKNHKDSRYSRPIAVNA